MIMDLNRNLAGAFLISVLFIIKGGSTNNRLSAGDRCFPNPCQNQAICRNREDGFACFCVPGFQGARCQIDVNECASQPCGNGATCMDQVGRFTCLCPPGFTGTTCEVRVDECHSLPCHHGGSCHSYVGGFTCTCLPGFQGDLCQINVDDCQENLCQNGALCVDGVNQYSCDCSHTGFTGRHCETPQSPCFSNPCFNDGICKETPSGYMCECWPGFEGFDCELDISECSSSPCLHGGRCIERSWQVLYGSDPLLPERYDQQQAAGFICSCPQGTKGSLCQELLSGCEFSPCHNGGRCESRVGGYICRCLEQSQNGVLYGGLNCDVLLVGCEDHECQNQGSCSPFLQEGTHGYTCVCPPGYTGPRCKTTTTFSFQRKGYLLLHKPAVDANMSSDITMSFKTVLLGAVLFQRTIGGLLLSLELEEGLLHLTLRTEESAGTESLSQVLELPHNVSDGEWHSVQVLLTNKLLNLKLVDDAGTCEGQSCRIAEPVQINMTRLGKSSQNTFIGGILEEVNSSRDRSAFPFVGCMRDVFVDRQPVVPEEWPSDSAVNVSPGCSQRGRCLDTPCQNGGECVNLQQSYECRCARPYSGHDCEDEQTTARFGSEDSHGFAAFTITDRLARNFSISLFLRTQEESGLLLALVNGSSPYLLVWLEDGKVTVQLHNVQTVQSADAINDGEVRFVNLEMTEGRVSLQVAGQADSEAEVETVGVQDGDTVYVGGLLDDSSTSQVGGYFKGCIQDLRVSDRSLQFFASDSSLRSFPLELMENVTPGCSGDGACSRNTCLNGGTCSSEWDGFTCACPPNTSGRRCEEVKWCELSPCPPDVECRMLDRGYECYSNATFLNDSTVLSFRGNGQITRNLSSLSLSLRTRRRNAAVLHAEKDSAFITVSVQDGVLFIELQSFSGETAAKDGDDAKEGAATVSLSSRRAVNDGEWHSVHVFMTAPWAPSSWWTLVMDDEVEEASISRSQGGNLNFLREDVDVFLGGLVPDAGWYLTGCLGTVELGGIALPYFGPSDVNLPRLQEEQFIQTSPHPPLVGCRGASVCEPNPCLNTGECQDLFNTYSCVCPAGWAGRRCDFFMDTCLSNPCLHGNCSVNGVTYECTCEFGYAGADCEEEVDVCEKHLCANGATCLHGPDKYACLCPENYTGVLCNERVAEIPWYIVVKNTRPKLPVSVCGDDTRNYTCFNGGNCTDRELSCDCPPGFMGHRCEQEVDECRSNPCLNGGYCRNLVNRFSCVCDMSYAGETCQTDVSDIYFYVAVLLWQNLFQLLSYLILRLDDGPEVDWGGND